MKGERPTQKAADTVEKTVENQEDELYQRCVTEIFDAEKITQEKLDEILKDFVQWERAIWGEEGFDEELFLEDLPNPENTVVFLRDTKTGKIVGFTYAEPVEHIDRYVEPKERRDPKLVAYISDTLVDPQYQGHGLVGKLMETLEEELRRRGYQYIERDTAVEGGYADNVRKNYASRIIEEQPHPSEYGDQVFFCITL
ncbi:MAG: GNAT family N-acetyltransferase [Candidatus Magasanikbacteria bacterium]|nr:GNAT family N-acetyltransferase [Candidatus Magasanikbacteria bacterium]